MSRTGIGNGVTCARRASIIIEVQARFTLVTRMSYCLPEYKGPQTYQKIFATIVKQAARTVLQFSPNRIRSNLFRGEIYKKHFQLLA